MIKPVQINKPDTNLIEMLEGLIERAKFTRFPLAAAITILAHRYPAAMIEDDSDEE